MKKFLVIFCISILFISCSLPSRHFSSVEKAKQFYSSEIGSKPKVYYDRDWDVKVTFRWDIYVGDYFVGFDYVKIKKSLFGWDEYLVKFDHLEYDGGYK